MCTKLDLCNYIYEEITTHLLLYNAILLIPGVHSAMNHNTIMNSSDPDYVIMETEADRVAKEAVKNIKMSRRQYKHPLTSKSNRQQ